MPGLSDDDKRELIASARAKWNRAIYLDVDEVRLTVDEVYSLLHPPVPVPRESPE